MIKNVDGREKRGGESMKKGKLKTMVALMKERKGEVKVLEKEGKLVS